MARPTEKRPVPQPTSATLDPGRKGADRRIAESHAPIVEAGSRRADRYFSGWASNRSACAAPPQRQQAVPLTRRDMAPAEERNSLTPRPPWEAKPERALLGFELEFEAEETVAEAPTFNAKRCHGSIGTRCCHVSCSALLGGWPVSWILREYERDERDSSEEEEPKESEQVQVGCRL